jgi:hypothetical protein
MAVNTAATANADLIAEWIKLVRPVRARADLAPTLTIDIPVTPNCRQLYL